jgi:hypothetical protein
VTSLAGWPQAELWEAAEQASRRGTGGGPVVPSPGQEVHAREALGLVVVARVRQVLAGELDVLVP